MYRNDAKSFGLSTKVAVHVRAHQRVAARVPLVRQRMTGDSDVVDRPAWRQRATIGSSGNDWNPYSLMKRDVFGT